MQSHSQNVGGIQMRWEEIGEGSPIVFVHGIPTSPVLWRRVIPLIGRGRCLALEMVGYGQSIPLGIDRDVSVAKQADYLLSWLDALGISRAVLVGHDLGGGVVQIAAVRRPAIAAGIVLTNAISYDSWPIPSVKMMRAMGGLIERLPSRVVKAMVAPLFVRGHDDQKVGRESLHLHWEKYQQHDGGAALIRQMRALDVNDTLAVAPELPQLRGTPAKVIWGASDAFQKVHYGERLARDLGASFESIDGGKHFTPEDHPERIAAGVIAIRDAAFGSG